MDSIKKSWQRMVGQPEEEKGLFADTMEDVDECCGDVCKLSYKERIYGFGICFGIGFLLSIIGTALISTGNITAFAVCYSIGTCMALGSSFFLWGPWSQLKSMFKQYRWATTLVMLTSIAMTLVSALVWKSVGLTILFAIVQFCAWLWYCLSYIPYARKVAMSCFQSCAA